jgi:hypothetical protein
MNFYTGLLQAVNWAANVVCPILGAFFLCAALYFYGQPHSRYTHYWYGAWGMLLVPGLMRLFEAFATKSAASDPDSYYVALYSAGNWLANVILPMNAVAQLAKAIGEGSGIFSRTGHIRVWGPAHHVFIGLMSLCASGIVHLVLWFIGQGAVGLH